MSAPCVKCGGRDIATMFHAQGCDRDQCSCASCPSTAHVKEHGEHLHYSCRTCHFDWIGPTIEQAATA